jgi:nucleotide-binding universal stress UspA family protein
MTPLTIVSYDDTQNDHDALMLGGMLREAGARLELAYIRHATHRRADEEDLSQREAEALLERGARTLEDPALARRIVVSASTGEGLGWLAETDGADIVVFGSDYRTSRGHVAIGRSAQRLLENGPVGLAFAPAQFAAAAPRVGRIGVLRGSADEAAIETAFSLAGRMDAEVVDCDHNVDVLVVGSRPEARPGRVMITSRAHNAIEQANCPVLVVAQGVPIYFETLVTA